eukprot:CAMPEP_0184491674 /NCGR_PEP_ID=MMETSP0113_2-20130426/21030_1 /TAXON_ID=91329 /ORGANISM="Norrisiella sphaerica, Strain BC52" /LENGTH=592 /DNA_ID=CAMNT_0026876131 /DNA_START=138 /DNA_END=1916 /DNA_ORIENTATION=+
MTESKLDPLDLLKGDLQDEDHATQVDCAKRLALIAKAIGPKRTRKDLLEYLDEYLKAENDEALVAIGKSLADVAKFVGGPEYMGCLVPILEKLASQEETVVCDAAATSMASLITEMRATDVEKIIVPALERMTTAEWFQPRVGVSKLFPAAFPRVGETSQEKITQWFSALCKDENPMVKKAALINMGHLSNAMGKNKIRDNMMSKLKDVCNEDSDLMRLYAVKICKEMTKTFNETKEFVSVLWPVVLKLAEDSSWRVRKELAEVSPDFARVLGSEIAGKELLPIFVGLLRDKEPEVKITASEKLQEVCSECKEGVDQVAQVLRDLIEDTNQTVRANVSGALGDITIACGDKQIESMMHEVLKIGVKDEDSMVRCNTLESIRKVAKSTASPPSTLFTILQPFASDPKWRVRREYLRASTAFTIAAAKSEDASGYDQKLTANLIECLSDHISSIREEACIQLAAVVETKGGEWGVKELLPEALKSVSQTDMAEQSNYLTRMTGLILVKNISQHLSAEQIEEHVLPFVEQCLKDVVENVRFKAARTCDAIIPKISKKALRERIIPALEAVQKGEQDTDILFYSEQALHAAAKYSE